MIGADRWIAKNRYRRFHRLWWADVLWWLPRRVIVHKWQRFTRGYSVFDMFNGDGFIADVVSATAYHMFATAHHYPELMTYDEWLDILLEIRDGFTANEDDINWTVPDMAWDLLRENHRSLWD